MRKLPILILCLFTFQYSWGKLRIVAIDPVNGVVVLRNLYTDTININKWILSYNETDTQPGHLKIISGDTLLVYKEYVYLKVKGLNYNHGYLALHDLRYNQKIGSKNGLMDYVQWGSAGHKYEDLADSTYMLKFDSVKMVYDTNRVWKKNTYISTQPPYNFIGNSASYGVLFWQSYKLPQLGIRLCMVIPSAKIMVLKNSGLTNIDISGLQLCIGDTCIDSISRLNILRGNINLSKNDSIYFNGITWNDSVDNISLFFPLNDRDTTNLIDFVQWGGYAGGYAGIASQKGWGDSILYVNTVKSDTLIYTGNFSTSQTGVNYWKTQNRKDTAGNTGIILEDFNTNLIRHIGYDGVGYQIQFSEQVSYQIIDLQGIVLDSGKTGGHNLYISQIKKSYIFLRVESTQTNRIESKILPFLH